MKIKRVLILFPIFPEHASQKMEQSLPRTCVCFGYGIGALTQDGIKGASLGHCLPSSAKVHKVNMSS